MKKKILTFFILVYKKIKKKIKKRIYIGDFTLGEMSTFL